jgi:hypothetical protein
MRSGAGGGPLKTAEGAGISLRMYAGFRREAAKMRTKGERRAGRPRPQEEKEGQENRKTHEDRPAREWRIFSRRARSRQSTSIRGG